MKEVLGEWHPSILTTMNNLALTYWNLGQKDKALGLELEVLDARKEVLGERHPDTLTTMHNLVHMLMTKNGSIDDVITELATTTTTTSATTTTTAAATTAV